MQTELLVEDILATETYLVEASLGKRFLNYLIDGLAYYFVLFVLAVLLAVVMPAAMEQLSEQEFAHSILTRLVSLVLYALFMSVVEAAFKGRSLGKLVTGTKAVNLDGTPISPGSAFGRGFSRAVPFCVFSAFGNPSNPWHDRWTKTMVIDIKKSQLGQVYNFN